MNPPILGGREAVVIAMIAVCLGRFVNTQVAFPRTYQIPESVTGGIVASLLVTSLLGLFLVALLKPVAG